ncbi:sigma-54 interaction domain-containing protein [Candidatus Nitrospira allomarina]|uniref:Sigma 54-interacting transcriptional regulator n=1 Tax=Candidatus Nitrospira allomarina TaxID=3020900 RepID=A0AA96GEZ9_9BACT|nr:sigma 54-interacting transcriptional regulator [Candidatus Nitrospira allomarina]WNM56531.1 sigma 54-interacting transcriptional regulator [Candidatus Nitrospira allomarina]
MAGSFVHQDSDSDVSWSARIEGLKFLAQQVDEPVVIFNPRKELVYANPSANKIAKDCPLILSSSLSSSDSLPSNQTPCDPCHAMELFRSDRQVQDTFPCPSHSVVTTPGCPLPRAVPLRSGTGMTHVAILMGARGSESIMMVPQDEDSSDPPAMSGDSLTEALPPTIIGGSDPIQQLVEMVRLIAASEATVLIQGESGTGKELVAKTIHALSRRRLRPFIVVECSALPETLLESELFGHVRGSFTGAVADRKGLFEEAEGGTIFLDEITDTTPAFQARLLRVLQEGEIKPVGSNGSVKVNVRVISAGNKPLDHLVATKLFRADLYYRLAVLPLTVPPLRERREDILLLVEYFLDQCARKHGRGPMQVSPDAQTALLHHSWPGNVRELENLIERVVVTCPHSTLEVKDFFADHPLQPDKRDLSSIGKIARQEAERSRILQALRDVKGDKTRAARALNISRSSLYNKLRDYHIS